MAVTVALFVAGISMGLAGVLVWAWGVRSGQFRDLEKTKDQLFWPELAGDDPKKERAPLPNSTGVGGDSMRRTG